jgi:hypothetical protein
MAPTQSLYTRQHLQRQPIHQPAHLSGLSASAQDDFSWRHPKTAQHEPTTMFSGVERSEATDPEVKEPSTPFNPS